MQEWKELVRAWRRRSKFWIIQIKIKKSCREIAAQFQIVKTAASSILKDGKKLGKEFEFFKDKKMRRAGQFSLINEAPYKWYGKCCA